MKLVVIKESGEVHYKTRDPINAMAYFIAVQYGGFSKHKAEQVIELVDQVLYEIMKDEDDLSAGKVIDYVIEEFDELNEMGTKERHEKVRGDLI